LSEIRTRPRPPLFPYTTLFRSGKVLGGGQHAAGLHRRHRLDTQPGDERGIFSVRAEADHGVLRVAVHVEVRREVEVDAHGAELADRKSTRLNSSHVKISYAVFC